MQPEVSQNVAESSGLDWTPFTPPADSDRDFKLRRVIECLASRLAPQGAAVPEGPCRLDAFEAEQIEELREIDAGADRLELGDTFWCVAVRHLEPTGLLRLEDQASLRGWLCLLQAMAELAGLHHRGSGLVAALSRSGIEESRISELWSARGPELAVQVIRMARELRAKNQRVDCFELASLVVPA